jgi:hypothetical protein
VGAGVGSGVGVAVGTGVGEAVGNGLGDGDGAGVAEGADCIVLWATAKAGRVCGCCSWPQIMIAATSRNNGMSFHTPALPAGIMRVRASHHHFHGAN